MSLVKSAMLSRALHLQYTTLQFVAAITDGSVKNMGLKVNDAVTVAIKAAEVMAGK
jgi:molybdopterin-binding protein